VHRLPFLEPTEDPRYASQTRQRLLAGPRPLEFGSDNGRSGRDPVPEQQLRGDEGLGKLLAGAHHPPPHSGEGAVLTRDDLAEQRAQYRRAMSQLCDVRS
jgi:hypothetical protein